LKMASEDLRLFFDSRLRSSSWRKTRHRRLLRENPTLAGAG